MKIRAVVQMTNEIDNNKLDVLNFRLIMKIVNDAPEYTWLNETEDLLTPEVLKDGQCRMD